jgi:hypothetical protein
MKYNHNNFTEAEIAEVIEKFIGIVISMAEDLPENQKPDFLSECKAGGEVLWFFRLEPEEMSELVTSALELYWEIDT